MKPSKEYLKNLKNHTITEQMLSDCIYSINNRALNSRDNEYKYTHYIPDTYGNANKYRKKKIYGNNRRVMQRNPIFYCNFGKNKADGKPDYHHMRYNKYKMDIEIYNDMKKTSYEDVILNLFGDDIRSKAEWLDII